MLIISRHDDNDPTAAAERGYKSLEVTPPEPPASDDVEALDERELAKILFERFADHPDPFDCIAAFMLQRERARERTAARKAAYAGYARGWKDAGGTDCPDAADAEHQRQAVEEILGSLPAASAVDEAAPIGSYAFHLENLLRMVLRADHWEEIEYIKPKIEHRLTAERAGQDGGV